MLNYPVAVPNGTAICFRFTYCLPMSSLRLLHIHGSRPAPELQQRTAKLPDIQLRPAGGHTCNTAWHRCENAAQQREKSSASGGALTTPELLAHGDHAGLGLDARVERGRCAGGVLRPHSQSVLARF